MNAEQVRKSLVSEACERLRVVENGHDKFRIGTPFVLGDGDLLALTMRKIGDGWVLTDNGETFMRLGYREDDAALSRRHRRDAIRSTLEVLGVENRNGSLLVTLSGRKSGEAMFALVQAILRLHDLQDLRTTRTSRKKTPFSTRVELLLEELAHGEVEREWTNANVDAKGNYPVEFRINGRATPLFIFSTSTDHLCKEATITMGFYHERQKAIPHHPIAVLEKEEDVTERNLDRMIDVCGADNVLPSFEAARRVLTGLLRQGQIPPQK